MKRDDQPTDVQLEDAFQLFNQLSQTLADSYGDLQTQVEHLSTELARARSERLKQLAEKERIANRLERLLDTLPAGIVVLDSDGTINQVNPVAEAMLGSDLMGQSWDQVAQQALLSVGDELRLKDGRWVSLSARSLDAEPGRIILITDITETRTLQAMVSRQQRLTSLGEMSASLAHQIRTPLAAALLYLSNLSHPEAGIGDRFHYAEKARERLHLLERMVNDMLVFARGEVTDAERFDVAELIDDFHQQLEPQIAEAHGSVTIDNQANDASLCGNRDALISAFHNLVNNAIEACDDRPELTIAVTRIRQGLVEFRFSDNGRGMSDEVRDRAMEPFYTTRASGTGLGLAVVNATVAGYNGELDIQSEEGEGSCISIRLPLSNRNELLPSDISEAGSIACRRAGQYGNGNNQTSEYHPDNEVSL